MNVLENLRLQPRNDTGVLVAFCGLDGAGKTAQITRLLQRARGQWPTQLSVQQPSGSIRKLDTFRAFNDQGGRSSADYRGLLLLTLGDRVIQEGNTIKPCLRDGGLVVCDRYVFCSMANVFSRGFDKDAWIAGAASLIAKPDVAIYLDVSVDTAVKRIRQRIEERDLPLDLPHMERLRTGYKTLSRLGHLLEIDSDTQSEDAVASEIWRAVEATRATRMLSDRSA